VSANSVPPGPASGPVVADDLPPSARAMIALLSSSLDRQARIAESNADRVAALGDRVDAMGEKVSAEIGSAMRHQTKVLSALVLIALVLLGGAAGISFVGDGFGVSVSTASTKSSAVAAEYPIDEDSLEAAVEVRDEYEFEAFEAFESDAVDDPGLGSGSDESGSRLD